MDHKMPMTPNRSVSHAAFSYCGRYCAITFQSIAVLSFLSEFPVRRAGAAGFCLGLCALPFSPARFPLAVRIYPFS